MKNILLALLLISGAALLPAQAQNLESVLDSMDRAAASFHTAQCDFVSDQYQRVVDDHDIQKGVMYFRRQGAEVEMASEFTTPIKKYVLFTGGVVSLYEPNIDQVTEYNAGKNKADFESFLVLGFGGRGHDLEKSFDLKYAGMEQVQGVNAAKLELTPKSPRVKNMFQTITLWIDLSRGISVQQEFLEPSGDYRVAKYSNIQINRKLPNDVFKSHVKGGTKVVRPNG